MSTTKKHSTSPRSDREFLTTGQVAKFMGVAPRTASKMIDGGQVRGFRIPGTQDRRVPRAEFLRFLQQNGWPIPPELGGSLTYHVLLIGTCPLVREAVEAANGVRGYRCVPAHDAYEAGELSVYVKGDCAVLNLIDGGTAANIVLAGMSRSAHWAPRPVVVLGTEDESELSRFTGYPNFVGVSHPWSPATVARVVHECCEKLR